MMPGEWGGLTLLTLACPTPGSIMTSTQRKTAFVICGSILALIGWDIYAEEKGGNEATISQEIMNASKKSPVIPFAFGVLMGHFFASQKNA
jgi:hypothetical protein